MKSILTVDANAINKIYAKRINGLPSARLFSLVFCQKHNKHDDVSEESISMAINQIRWHIHAWYRQIFDWGWPSSVMQNVYAFFFALYARSPEVYIYDDRLPLSMGITPQPNDCFVLRKTR